MRHRAVLILLTLILATSGCLNGGESTDSDGAEAIEIQELSIQPQSIYAGSSSTVILHIQNVGEIPAELTLDSGYDGSADCSDLLPDDPYDHPSPTQLDEYYGCIDDAADEDEGPLKNDADRILTDRCRDIFDVEQFDVTGPNDVSSEKYVLDDGEEVRFSWSLSTSDDTIPLHGYECPLRFEVPFEYSVNAYRQVQVKESREIDGIANLESRSSQGPLMIDIDTIGSTSDQGSSTFIDGDNAEIGITIRNQGQEGTQYTGLIEVDAPNITSSSSIDHNCPEELDDDMTLHEGESQTIRCDLEWEDVDGSFRADINAETDYNYVKSLGTHNIEVEHRGR